MKPACGEQIDHLSLYISKIVQIYQKLKPRF